MIVQAPDNKTIDFGDMPPDQVTAAMQKLYPKSPEMLPDVAKSFGTGLGQGAVGLVTAPLDIGTSVGGWLANKAVGDSTMGLDSNGSVYKGLDYLFNQNKLGLPQEPPSVGGAIDNAVGLDYKPQTLPGKFANTIGQFGPAVAALTEGNGAPLSQIAKRVIGKSVASGTGSEALGEATEGTQLEPYARVAGAVLGERVPALAGPGLSNIGTGIKARSTEQLQDTVTNSKNATNPLYEQFRKKGDALKPEATSGLLESLDNSLNSLENKYIPELAPQTTAIVNAMRKEAGDGMLGVSDIDQYRRKLSRVSGVNPEDTFSAGLVRKAIDNHLNGLGAGDLINGNKDSINLLNQARAQSAKSFRVEAISDILSKADGDTNKIKSGLTRFVSDEDNLKGFNLSEIQALREAAKSGIGEKLLTGLSKFGIDTELKNMIPALLGGGLASTFVGGPFALGLATAGTAAKAARPLIARGKAEKALRTIENRGEEIQPEPKPMWKRLK